MHKYVDKNDVFKLIQSMPDVDMLLPVKFMKALYELPEADVRPVVLCRDCKYSYDSVGGWCCSHGICVDCIVREDFFCAEGERREE